VKILIQCAWCLKHLGEKEPNKLEETAPLISHSICPACYAKFSADIRSYTNCPDAGQAIRDGEGFFLDYPHFRTVR
jgi:hypothetical protein